ncbi:hypothetical protein ACOMHN_036306 [Nucella lapillus]
MATASPRRWARIQRRVLQPTSTSIDFQEALRLCRQHQEDQQQPMTSQTDEEMDHSGDMGSVSLNNSNNSSYGTDTPTTTTTPTPTTTPTTTTTSRRTRRNSNSSSSNNSEHHKTQHTPRRQQQQQQRQQQQHQRLRLPLPDLRTPSPEEEKGGGGEDSLLEGCESSSSQRTEGSLRPRPCDQTPMGRLMHVSWADHSQQDLVREHPRKRFSRRPSLAEPGPPKSILKAMQ